ncbi:MAG: hypothetical protein Ct9H300mP12_14280 [Acidimicrobiales bacterium]|nr:MAG: hypothetical protein Ct9H300mP12_14280 [Acidimicrobiales bacterium]
MEIVAVLDPRKGERIVSVEGRDGFQGADEEVGP